MAAYVVNKSGVADMLRYFVVLRSRRDADSATRQGDHFQMVLVQQIAQSFRLLAIVFQNVAAQLNTGKSKFRDFLDRLRVVPIPSDCRVPEVNLSWRRSNRIIKVGEIHRGIKRWLEHTGQGLKGKSRRGCRDPEPQDEMTSRRRHELTPSEFGSYYNVATDSSRAGLDALASVTPWPVRDDS